MVEHELIHLLEKNHTLVFADYLDNYLPDWCVTKEELNGFILDRYMKNKQLAKKQYYCT